MSKSYKMVLSAIFSAIIAVATFIVQIPVYQTGGYVNLGDAFVLLSGIILGPFWSFLASGIGSAAADLLFGYVSYAPATFLIKGLMALIMALLFRARKKEASTLYFIILAILSEAVMVISYFLFEAFAMGFGLGAAAAIPGNLMQGAFALIISTLLFGVLKNNKKFKSFF